MAATPKPVRSMLKKGEKKVRENVKKLTSSEGGHMKSIRKEIKKSQKNRTSNIVL